MAMADLIQKLRTKKQAATKTAFGNYLATVRELASGAESDADAVADILDAAGRDESALERDVRLQEQRYSWAAQLQRNRQADVDRLLAESELAVAQCKLQAAVSKLQPAIDQAFDKLNAANHNFLSTMNADAMLAGNLIDVELLQRESVIVRQLRDVQAELAPLLKDRGFKSHSLGNAEFEFRKLTGRSPSDWSAWGIEKFFHKNQAIRAAEARVADCRSVVAQLDAAIQPRQARQRELQSELSQIHAEKLQP